MKATIKFLLAASLFLSGCEKEALVPIYSPGNMTYGRADAKKNGRTWVASSAAYLIEVNPAIFAVGANTFSEDGFVRENIVFYKIPMKPGKYPVTIANNNQFDGMTGASYHTSEDDGVSEDSYRIDKSAPDNYIEVILVDTVANMARGEFTVSFELVTTGGKRNPDNPDKVKFSKGSFDVEFLR